jgi:hypothetical protein
MSIRCSGPLRDAAGGAGPRWWWWWLEQWQELVQLWNVLSGIDPPAFDDPNHVWPANLTDLGWELGWPVGWRPGLVVGQAPDGQ